MPNKPEMETRSVKDLQNDAAALVKQVGETKQPIRIKGKGQPPVVLLDEDTYDWYIHLINFNRLLNEGEADIRAGRTRPVEEFFKEQRRARRVSS
jgi:PHD/YefM family antitoxin component YafN of YafNO toxin-antitoxin module